ncbi:hypothetical protein H4R33_005555, partial [Dimargaris cristalligena]
AGEDLETRFDAELLSTPSLDIHHDRMYPTVLNSALREALRATRGDIADRTLAECHERCWLYAVRLRALVIESVFPPAIIFKTLFLAALYPAAVTCHERAHGMGVLYPTPVELADRQLANRFMDEIVHALGTFGDLWQANLKIVDEIRQKRNSPFTRRVLSIGHLL